MLPCLETKEGHQSYLLMPNSLLLLFFCLQMKLTGTERPLNCPNRKTFQHAGRIVLFLFQKLGHPKLGPLSPREFKTSYSSFSEDGGLLAFGFWFLTLFFGTHEWPFAPDLLSLAQRFWAPVVGLVARASSIAWTLAKTFSSAWA
jgi:hypothetical protein